MTVKVSFSNFYCPFCLDELRVTHQERYQDLSEHVSNPNGKPSLKDGYECLNKECLAFGTHAWIEDGEVFSSRPQSLDWKEWERLRKVTASSENFHSIGSWNYYYQRSKDAIKKKTVTIDLKWYKLNIYPKEHGWEYPIEKRHMPHPWKRKLEIWKKSSDYGYTHVIPFWRMTSFSLREFRSCYKVWKEQKTLDALESAYSAATGIDRWGNKDDRFYKRLTTLIIFVFMNRKRREIVLGKKSSDLSRASKR
jgi:hypothetical protein